MNSVTTLQSPIKTQSLFEIAKENLRNPKKWFYLVPTISVIALGLLFTQNFALGLAFGVADVVLHGLGAAGLAALGFTQKHEENDYSKFLLNYPSLATLGAPILEEGLFRGLIQPLTARCILWVIPAAGAALLGSAISIAMTVSIIATASLFGFVHYFNEHKNAHLQAIISGLGGVTLGLVAARFGLAASIAQHIMNNTIAVSGLTLVTKT